MVQNRFHISRLRLHFGMILQDVQPEPSEKVRSPENDFEYVLDNLFFIPENKARAHSRGLCFTRQASILHAECLC